MTRDTVLELAKAQGFTISPARAQEIAEAIAATLAVVGRIPVAFEAEPELFHAALEEAAR